MIIYTSGFLTGSGEARRTITTYRQKGKTKKPQYIPNIVCYPGNKLHFLVVNARGQYSASLLSSEIQVWRKTSLKQRMYSRFVFFCALT